MTSNIEKLNQITPLLAGSKFWTSSYTQDGSMTRFSVGEGLFHSLEIDAVYPESEPMVYFRAINVAWKHYDWDSTGVYEEEEKFCELAYEIEMIKYIEHFPRQPWDDGFMAEQFVIQFRGSSEARLIFAWP